VEEAAKKQYGDDWKEYVSEETQYFKDKGKFKTGNLANAIKEFIKNLVNRIK